MKKISVFLALLAFFFADAALARAVVMSLTGTAQAQAGTAAARQLRLGDEVVQGDTVSTGPNSALGLRFDDGQVTALTQNSRMTITAYQYNEQAGTGNVLLSLLTGGMRAVTGLIGKNTPDRVTYRAANATIGIRGTDVTILTDGANVTVLVDKGEISFTYNGVTTKAQTINVPAGFGVQAGPAFTFLNQIFAIGQIFSSLPPNLQTDMAVLRDVIDAVFRASAGQSGTLNRGTFTPNTGSGASGGAGGGGTGTGPPSP